MQISTRLDHLQFGPFHFRLLVMGRLGYFFDAADVAIIAFLLPSLRMEWGLGSPALGLLAAGTSIGGIIGALGAGLLGDRLGRRPVIMWALAIYCIASLACALAQDWRAFLLFRIIGGLGTSAESAIVAPYLAEFAAPSFRGRYLGSLTASFSGGFLFAALLGYVVVPMGPSAWRYAIAFTALPIGMLLWWRRSLPESPRWLERQGRFTEAEAVVAAIELESETAPSHCVLTSSPARNPNSSASAPRLTMVLLLWFAVGFAYYAFFTWAPTLLVDEGRTVARSFGLSIAIYGAQLPGYAIASALNDRLGRRWVIAGSLLIGAAGSVALSQFQNDAALLASGVILSMAMNGSYAGLYAYTAELFPTEVRARAQGAAGAISRIGATLGPIAVPLIYRSDGLPGVFAVTCLILGSASLLVLALGPETRGWPLDAGGSATEAD